MVDLIEPHAQSHSEASGVLGGADGTCYRLVASWLRARASTDQTLFEEPLCTFTNFVELTKSLRSN